MGSSPDINYPAQPSYGEGMADAMKAQMEQLLGQGDYAQMYADAGFAGGDLGDIIAGVEAPIRQQTAQVDTDVLRQTLLGSEKKFQVEKDPDTGKYGITGAEVVKGEDGKPQTAGDGRYQMVMIGEQRQVGTAGQGSLSKSILQEPAYAIIDTETGGVSKTFGGELHGDGYKAKARAGGDGYYIDYSKPYKPKSNSEIIKETSIGLQSLKQSIADAGGDTDAAAKEFQFKNPYTGEPLEEGQTVTIREGDGMIDLLGDKRKALDPTTGLESDRMAGFDADGNFLGLAALAEDIQRGNLSRQREADLSDVERLSERYSDVMDDFRPGTQQALTDASAVLEAQKETLTGAGALTVPSTSTYAGDITASEMTAATVADPLTLSASTSYDPSAEVSGGTFDAGTSYTATAVADPMKLTAATSYTPSTGVKGSGYTATTGLQGGNIGQDKFREALMTQATAALDNGLSERELASISNAARARSSLMGRTFDQQGAIDESKALVLEDQKRRMQNRAFAQQALGQEADIRERDLSRGLQASMQNQTALNRAAEFGASQSMQAQLANQAATNQALSQGLSAGLSQEALAAQQAQAKAMADATATNRASEFGVGAGLQQETQANQAGLQAQLANQQATNQAAQFAVGAGMEQDALAAQLGQQTNLAQAELNQQAAAFDADATQRASQLNQAQAQQANQFDVGATMDAQRLNEQLKQAGTLGYVDAATRLAALEDQYALDPFQALLGRASGGSLQSGGQVFGQASYGLNSGPQYLNPEAGLGYISSMAANNANMYAANQAANASRSAGLMGMFGDIGGSLIGLKKPF